MSLEPRLTTLDNGLRIVSDRMAGVASVTLGVWTGIGSRHEAAAENGVAHLFEHMAFKGTSRRSARAIAEEIEAVGGQLNAWTGREVTAFHARLLAEDLPLGFDILADILTDPVLDPEELARERQVVLQEIAMVEDTPDDIIFDHFQATAYPGQALGRPVLGPRAIIADLPRTALAAWIGGHYAPERMVVAASGAVEHERLVALAERAFGARPRREAAPAEEPAAYRGGEWRGEDDLEQAHIVLGFPGLGFRDPDHYVLQALSTLVGGGMSSRLFQEVREQRGLCYAVYSFASAYRDGGLFAVYAGTGEGQVDTLVPVVCEQLLAVTEAVTEAELARARAQLKAGTLMALESTQARAELIAQSLIGHDRIIPVEEIVRRIEAVTVADVVRVARRLFRGTAPTLAALGPLARLESYDNLRARLA